MANPVCEVLLTDEPLSQSRSCFAAEAGATVDFWGVVRPTESGCPILGINYEAHRAMAAHQLRAIAAEAAHKFPLQEVIIRHRLGLVPAGEASLLVRCAAKHRAEGFTATEWIVDELKKRVPIWKHVQYRAAADLPELVTTTAE